MSGKKQMTDTNIPVRAIRMGHFNSEIKEIGAEFVVPTEAELGSWMERRDGKPNWAENRHLIVEESVKNKTFQKLDETKIKDENKIKNAAEKDVAQAHADAKPEAEILTPAQKAAATRAANKAKAEAEAAPKKAAGKKANTEGLI